MSQTADKRSDPKLITVQKFKDEYGVSHTTAYRLFKQEIETVKVGRSTLVVRESAERWLGLLRSTERVAA